MIHEDMSVQERWSELGTATVVLVGWIADDEFPKARSPDGMLPALVSLIFRDPDGLSRNMIRGPVGCPLCDNVVFLCGDGTEAACFTGEDFGKHLGTVAGDRLLGSDELWIPSGNGEFIVSPSLVPHYIGVHDYCPPPELWSAVVANQP